jgi:hypothetical protein
MCRGFPPEIKQISGQSVAQSSISENREDPDLRTVRAEGPEASAQVEHPGTGAICMSSAAIRSSRFRTLRIWALA